jgi:malonate decarboxylase epsilon subunit
MSVAFLFPGQGAQRSGMLHHLPEHPAIVHTLEEASAILDVDAQGLDTHAALASTVAAQLALCIAGVAAARALMAEGATPDLVAGLSVGAFAAAVAASSLDFPDALRLVHLRAILMERAYPRGYGMGVIIGLQERQVERLVAAICSEAAPVYIANVNAPRQIAIAGANTALAVALAEARAQGAVRAERLRVTVPSHCPLLADVAAALADALDTVEVRPPRVPYLSNRRARALTSAEAVSEDLAANVAYPVRWHEITATMAERGARLFVEMPPGQVLTDLAAAAFPAVRAVALATSRLDSVLALIQREAASGIH